MVDMCIAVDTVGYTSDTWRYTMQGLSNFLSQLNIGPQGTQVALYSMRLASAPILEFSMTRNQTTAGIAASVANLTRHALSINLPGHGADVLSVRLPS